jgi:DNA-binding NarL/FixJ family response regulator
MSILFPIEKSIRVLLADDHDILRQGLRFLLEAQQDMQVVGEARTGYEAIEQAVILIPDVVVMDISMSGLDGLTACQRIRNQLPTVQVLILTMHESEEYFLQSLRLGAAGYIVKKAAPGELSAAVRTIAHGGAYLYPGLAKALVRAYVISHEDDELPGPYLQQAPPGSSELAEALNVLTPREMEVLKLVAAGRTNQEIANILVISIKTVQAHRANLMEKLGLHDITHLVRFAIHHGLISSEF